MGEDQVREWLGTKRVSDEKVADLVVASRLADRLTDGEPDRSDAFRVMARLILGDETIDDLTARLRAAEETETVARDRLYAGIVWSIRGGGGSESGMARDTGIARGTIRRILGKDTK